VPQSYAGKDKRSKNGGARKGGGRKLGAATQKTRAVADQWAASGKITPLQVMLAAMELAFQKKKFKEAAAIAAQAAPYCHPRLSSIEYKSDPAEPVHVVERLILECATPPPGTQGSSDPRGVPAL
jgi:hypothetical protein